MDFVKKQLYNICKSLKYKLVIKSDSSLYKEYIIKITATHFFNINIYEYDDQTKGCDISINLFYCGLNATIIDKSRISYCVAESALYTFFDELSNGRELTRS